MKTFANCEFKRSLCPHQGFQKLNCEDLGYKLGLK